MFDTLKYSRVLDAAGISREQAEAHVRAISDIIEGNLATKYDIEKLRVEVIQLEYRLVIKLSAVLGTMITIAVAVTAALSKSV